MNARLAFIGFSIALLFPTSTANAALAVTDNVDWQPFAAQIRRVVDTLESVGEPLLAEDNQALQQLLTSTDSSDASARAQQILDKYCIAGVQINPESRVKLAIGDARHELVEQGWRTFLVKVQNEAGV